MDERELLREYAQTGSHAAFGQLVSRYVDLVYTAALRQVRDPGMAQDVTQAVFIVLARKAGRLSGQVALSGWLLNTTRYGATNALRARRRRDRHERTAAAMTKTMDPGEDHANWEEIEPHLDQAMAGLNKSGRDAVAMRYFEGLSTREVADRLNVTENTAKQRIFRALEKLRSALSRRGVKVSAAGLGTVLAQRAVEAAPLQVAAAAGAMQAAPASAAAIVKGILIMSAANKVKGVAVAALCALLVGTSVGVFLYGNSGPAKANKGPVQVAQIVPVPTAPTATAPATRIPSTGAIRGVVRGPDGKALPGAEVALVSGTTPATLYGPLPRSALMVMTAGDGSFEVPKPIGRFSVVARHGQGTAIVTDNSLDPTVRDSSQITLDVQVKGFGQVGGQLMIGGRPGAGQWVVLYHSNAEKPTSEEWNISGSQTMAAGADGRFVFQKVAAGNVIVAHVPDPKANRTAQQTPLKLEPGQTLEVQIGGRGRPVIGKVPAAGELPGLSNTTTASGRISASGYVVREPAEPQREIWWRTLYGGYYRGRNATDFVVARDGTFRVEDIPTGRYRFVVRYSKTNLTGQREQVAQVIHRFEVPQVPGGQSDEPLDLGTLDLTPSRELKAGDAAPWFDLPAEDGKPLRLAGLQGKHVLILFWASWNVFSADEIAAGKALQSKWDGRLEIIGLNIDRLKERADRAAKEQNIPWRWAFIGHDSELVDLYSIETPQAVLVAPDGKVVARGLTDRSIIDAVEGSLGAAAAKPGEK